jgi:hypothetical protein
LDHQIVTPAAAIHALQRAGRSGEHLGERAAWPTTGIRYWRAVQRRAAAPQACHACSLTGHQGDVRTRGERFMAWVLRRQFRGLRR